MSDVAKASSATLTTTTAKDTGRLWFVPPPPRTPKAAATRQRLLAVASDLFVARGYAAVSMRDIAAAAQMTKGGVYGHFRSKGQLLVEVIRWRLAAREHSKYFTDNVRDPERAIELMYDTNGREIRLLGVDAAATARHDPAVAAGLAQINQERQKAIRATVAKAGVSDPEIVAWFISVLSAGIAMKEAETTPWPDTERLRETLLAVLQSLVDQPPPDRPGRRTRPSRQPRPAPTDAQ
jgi:AcrR family transcriptional regulator